MACCVPTVHPARMGRRVVVAIVLAFVACAAPAPAPGPAPAAGAGLVRFDREPPAGATIWQRPTWRVGDRTVLVRGERARGALTVVAATTDHYEIDPGAGSTLRRDRDLGTLGEWDANGAPLHRLAPADVRYHWPLWLGKRWTCEFVDQARGGTAIVMQAEYVVEDLDTVTVPAGTFQARRIARTLRLRDVGDVYARWQVGWYAPDVGVEVRQMHGDTLVELVELVQPR